MEKIVLSGVPPYDGEYEFDASYFTMRELHTIKKVAGVRAGELEDALNNSDTDVVVALALIALQRNGVDASVDTLLDAQAASFSFVGAEEADDSPPDLGAAA